ncbi:MAG: D-aminoacylase [Anaerolineales bacterium]|nr:D-aminoacylase [Anaerolineales bacterium]
MFDLLIVNGKIIDGTGDNAYLADIAIQDGRIAAIGMLGEAEARERLEASGCVVTPGFVDIHSHADFILPILPTADSQVHQGITTTVVGQCGSSPAPLNDLTRNQLIGTVISADRPLPWDRWTSFKSYFGLLEEQGTSVNVVPVVGHGTIRVAVMGISSKLPDSVQMARMQSIAAEALDQGAAGISSGLIYPPGCYSDTAELVETTRPVGERGGIYFSHIRSEGSKLLESIEEAITVGRETGAAVQISHLKAAGRQNWHKAALALELIDRARAEGLDVTADMYPYEASCTGLVAMLPYWAQEGGQQDTLDRLSDPAICNKIISELAEVNYWDRIMISDSPENRSYEGSMIDKLANEADKLAAEWVCGALLETGLDMGMISFGMSPENIEMQLRHPATMIGTDSEGRAYEGPYAKGVPHPRNFGSFPRVLGYYVRQQKTISLEQAVWKCTGFAASKLKWTDRGLIKQGYQADLVVFNPDTIIDRSTFTKPHQRPEGIQYVLVNGEVVIREGAHTQALPGMILRAPWSK